MGKWYTRLDSIKKLAYFEVEDDDGNTVELAVPYTLEVCQRCDGEGRHVNPAIDGNGLTQEDFDADPDFREAYFEGRYDVVCEECGGRNVVPEVDKGACRSPKQKEALATLRRKEKDDAEYEQLCRMERLMGA